MSSEKKCKVEEVECRERATCKNYITLPHRILERKDLVLLAAGSLACVRGIYMTAAADKALDRFRYTIISPSEYATGEAAEKIKELIEKTIDTLNPAGIILYASCMEVITDLDFERIKSEIDNPDGIKIEMLKRGPLVKRHTDPEEMIEEILSDIPDSGKDIRSIGKMVPPPMPDFEAIASMVRKYKSYNVLLTVGGCDGCFGNSEDSFNMRKTRLNDLDISLGSEDLYVKGISDDKTKLAPDAEAILLGTAVPGAVGLDYDRIRRELEKAGQTITLIKTDGFQSGEEGISRGYRMLMKAKTERESPKRISNAVGILGSHALAASSAEKIAHGLEHLERDGFDVHLFENETLENLGAFRNMNMNWVVSLGGVSAADYLRQEYKIPYLVGIPVGKRAMMAWRRAVNSLMGVTADLSVPARNTDRKSTLRVLLAGDPVLTQGIAQYLYDMQGIDKVKRAVFTRIPSQEKWYETSFKMAENSVSIFPDETIPLSQVECFRNRTQWAELVESADIIICDRLLKEIYESMPEAEADENRKWVYIPDLLMSSGIRKNEEAKDEDYIIFGKKGAAWIAEKLGLPAPANM